MNVTMAAIHRSQQKPPKRYSMIMRTHWTGGGGTVFGPSRPRRKPATKITIRKIAGFPSVKRTAGREARDEAGSETTLKVLDGQQMLVVSAVRVRGLRDGAVVGRERSREFLLGIAPGVAGGLGGGGGSQLDVLHSCCFVQEYFLGSIFLTLDVPIGDGWVVAVEEGGGKKVCVVVGSKEHPSSARVVPGRRVDRSRAGRARSAGRLIKSGSCQVGGSIDQKCVQ